MDFFSKIQKTPGVWPRASNNWNLRESHPVGSEIIATRTTDDNRRTNPHTMHCQAELKLYIPHTPPAPKILRILYSFNILPTIFWSVSLHDQLFLTACLGSGVRSPPSVCHLSLNSSFSETAAWIQAKFYEKRPIHHMWSPDRFFFFFHFCFKIFAICLSLP